MNKNTKILCLNAIGIALFVVTSLCIQVPIFENYYFCLGYIVMLVFLYTIGTISGTLVGTLGVVLYCICISGLRGMPGWTIGNIIIGIILGLTFKVTKKLREKYKILSTTLEICSIIMATTIGILFAKSFVEYLLYAQPIFVRMLTNVYAYIADIITLIIALPIAKFIEPKIKKYI